ncbi:MAG TPA: hypothetical protein VHD61_05335 [Lacunisphaera sp.]|nr:hypothetical protein [Lacunisphaera sp.]
MRVSLRFVALLLVAGITNAKDPISDVLPAAHGEVVFVRQESNGSLNILQSTIVCDDWPRVILVGGEAGSVYLPEGDHSFQIFSPEPYAPDSPPRACQSSILRLKVSKGKKVYLEVIPESGDEKTKSRFYWSLTEKTG